MPDRTVTAVDAVYFLAALQITPTLPNGFALADIDHVESACWLRETDGSRYGYIVILKTGRRLYLNVTRHTACAVTPAGVEIVDLLPCVAQPDLGLPVDPYWYQPAILNSQLEELR